MNETFKPALPKVPFIIGDVLLVLTAILIANSGEGPLDPLSFFWVIVCVGMGAALACLPYIVEYRTVVATWNTFQDDQGVQMSTMDDSISKLTEQRKAFKEQAERNERIAGMMESMVKRLESRLQVLEEEEQVREKSFQEWQEALTEKLAEDREDLLAMLKKWGSEQVAEQNRSPVGAVQLLERLESAIQSLESSHEQEEATPSRKPSRSVAAKQGKKEEPKTELSEIVSEEVPEVGESAVEPEAEPETGDPTSDEPEAVEMGDEWDPPEEEPEDTGAGEGEVDWGKELGTDDGDEAADEVDESDEDEAETKSGKFEEAKPEQPELLEDLPASRLKAKKAGKEMSTLVAQLLIGIGNKPYVRGKGPGLSEEVGVPMEFLEIGKWQWVAPESSEQIVCQVYKNDETPAEGEPIVIEPGQRKVVAPRFS